MQASFDQYMVVGGCQCGNMKFTARLTVNPREVVPRGCNCNFCSAHGAAWLSVPGDQLTLDAGKDANLQWYRQGDQLADFMVCKQCKVLVGVCYEEDGHLFAAVNLAATEDPAAFPKATKVELRQLSAIEKRARWRDLWFHCNFSSAATLGQCLSTARQWHSNEHGS